jgi:hypothetical protein
MVGLDSPPSVGQRVMRVFVSSTFRDMQAEREELVKVVFPQLRKLCETRGVTWGEVDLRWGVTEEQKAEGPGFADLSRGGAPLPSLFHRPAGRPLWLGVRAFALSRSGPTRASPVQGITGASGRLLAARQSMGVAVAALGIAISEVVHCNSPNTARSRWRPIYPGTLNIGNTQSSPQPPAHTGRGCG